MTPLESAVAEVAGVLESLSVPYMLIGGLAVSIWGEPRATLDADWLVWVPPESLRERVASLVSVLPAMPEDPLAFVRQTRVLPVRTSRHVRSDIVFGTLPWEQQAIARAQPTQIAGRKVPLVSVEDLILMKLISEREKDLEDGRRLMRRFATRLDRALLEPQMRELAEALGRDDILRIMEDSFGG
jgi:predicted nucleotidyltransferase